MRIVITGATGFLGKHVVEHFKKKYSIVGLSRNSELTDHSFILLKTDYSINSLKKILKSTDTIIHLAAGRPNNTSQDKLQDNVNVDFNVFSVAYELTIKNIIFISTRGVYGTQPAPWSESDQVQPNNFYALAKAQSELIAQFFMFKGLNIKVLRIAQLLGIGEYKGNVIQTFIESASTNSKINLTVDGISREYIYIKDLLIAFEVVIKSPVKNGTYNVGSGEVTTLKEAATYIAEAFDRKEIIHEEIERTIFEYSLMDSCLFYKSFNWKPKYNFEMAAEDIAEQLTLR